MSGAAAFAAPANKSTKANNAGTAKKSTPQNRAQQARALVTQRASEHAQANAKLVAARKKLEQGLKSNPQLEPARKKVEEARKNYETISGPILASLHERPDYKAAIVARDKARQESKETTGLEGEARKAKIAETSKAISVPGKMEVEAIEKDPQAKAAHEKLLAARKELNELKARLEGDLRKEAGVPEATKAANLARLRLEEARRNAAVQEQATKNRQNVKSAPRGTGVRKASRTANRLIKR